MSLPRVNLMPSKRTAARRVRARVRRWAGVTGVTFASLAMLQLAPGPALAEAEVLLERRRVDASSTADRLRTENAELRRRLLDTRRKVAEASQLSDRPDWSIVLALLASRTGDRLSLETCEVTPLPGKGHRIAASGRALTQGEVTRFVLDLEAPGLFNTVELTRSRRDSAEGRDEVRFEIECVLLDDAKGTTR